MLFLQDTNGVSDLLRENPRYIDRLTQAAATDRVVTCTIVKGEVQFGIERLPPGKRRRELEAKAAALFQTLPCEPVLEDAASHYARIKVLCQTRGLSLEENDLWIAATCLALGAVLVTRDTDFDGVDGLVVEDWSR